MADPSDLIEKRIKFASNFKDYNLYLLEITYFDVILQVHSVVVTKRSSMVLRGWRATKFGPEKYYAKKEKRLFRVTQENFSYYVVPPDARIGKAIQDLGMHCLMEVLIYDEWQSFMTELKSGDYIVLKNVHAALNGTTETYKFHTGDAYQRGVSKIPDDFHNFHFQEFKARCESMLDSVTDYQDFEEFISEEEFYQRRLQSDQETEEEIERSRNRFAEPNKSITIGSSIAVDYFPTDVNKRCKYHFLTQADPDHCKGLTKSWEQKVYCSEKTAKILPFVLGFNPDEELPKWIMPLQVNKPHNFNGFNVMLIDQNHYPGSVMLYFLQSGNEVPELSDGPVLCTGDLRADLEFMNSIRRGGKLHWLTNKSFSTIFLDNTNFHSHVEFPTRRNSLRLLKLEVQNHPDQRIFFPMNRLGREYLVDKLKETFFNPLTIYKENALELEQDYYCELRNDGDSRDIEVVKMHGWRNDVPKDAIIFDISMNELRDGQVEQEENVIKISYSDHSSYAEIQDFLKLLDFKRIEPISKSYSEYDLKLMLRFGVHRPLDYDRHVFHEKRDEEQEDTESDEEGLSNHYAPIITDINTQNTADISLPSTHPEFTQHTAYSGTVNLPGVSQSLGTVTADVIIERYSPLPPTQPIEDLEESAQPQEASAESMQSTVPRFLHIQPVILPQPIPSPPRAPEPHFPVINMIYPRDTVLREFAPPRKRARYEQPTDLQE